MINFAYSIGNYSDEYPLLGSSYLEKTYNAENKQ